MPCASWCSLLHVLRGGVCTDCRCRIMTITGHTAGSNVAKVWYSLHQRLARLVSIPHWQRWSALGRYGMKPMMMIEFHRTSTVLALPHPYGIVTQSPVPLTVSETRRGRDRAYSRGNPRPRARSDPRRAERAPCIPHSHASPTCQPTSECLCPLPPLMLTLWWVMHRRCRHCCRLCPPAS
jgi:hypothetical protein